LGAFYCVNALQSQPVFFSSVIAVAVAVALYWQKYTMKKLSWTTLVKGD
jgi:hypothetical protein